MVSKIKDWMNKPLSNKVSFACIAAMLIFYAIRFLVCNIYDNDMYFLIATGREILKNGIPHINPWTIDDGQGFIAQQWLYTIGIAIAEKFSYLGFTVFVAIQVAVMVLLLNHFFNLKNVSKIPKFVGICVVLLLSQTYVFNIRPQVITMILLMTECIALEHYVKSNKWQWLLLLPLTTLLEINLHGSMWVFHYAILLAYIVPTSFIPGVLNTSIWKKYKALLIAAIIMFGVMFINPYGWDGIVYMFKSFMANTFDYIFIVETQTLTLMSAQGVILIITAVLMLFCYKFKVLDSVSLNITLGFTVLLVYMVRNSVFTIFVIAYLLRCFCSYISNIDLKAISKQVTNSTLVVLMVGVVFFALHTVSAIDAVFIGSDTNSDGHSNQGSDMESIADYIDECDTDKDVHIFTGFNVGGYMEYRGFNNVYIDARPELYTDEFTNDKHILADYSRYAVSGMNVDWESVDDIYVTREQMDDWFYSYDFEYVIVCPIAEGYIAAYMLLNDDYELVDLDTTTYLLYQKKIA